MQQPAISLDVLPAGFGDSLLLTCPTTSGVWRLLVDTGPDESYPALRSRLQQIPVSADGRRHIDLLVISHIDHDHIGGVGLLLNDRDLKLQFGDIWFNAPPRPASRGVAEGHRLAELLGAQADALPWNRSWGGGPACTPALGGGVELRGEGLPVVTVLSPTPDELTRLFGVWAKELERLRRKERDQRDLPEPARRGPEPSIEALAARKTALDKAVANGSSIAFLLEHRGASVLLCADAFSTVLAPALRGLAERRGRPGPLRVDAVKLSHHGSRANVTQEFLDLVQAQHYVFSTNNTYFGHPNQEAVARVILKGRGSTLWFNHDTPANRRWDSAALKAAYGYRAVYPDNSEAGVKIICG